MKFLRRTTRVIEGQSFTGEAIVIDGPTNYVNCFFEDCSVTVKVGSPMAKFSGCRFTKTSFVSPSERNEPAVSFLLHS
jgi:hypothetical protein